MQLKPGSITATGTLNHEIEANPKCHFCLLMAIHLKSTSFCPSMPFLSSSFWGLKGILKKDKTVFFLNYFFLFLNIESHTSFALFHVVALVLLVYERRRNG